MAKELCPSRGQFHASKTAIEQGIRVKIDYQCTGIESILRDRYTANDKCTIVDFAYQLNDS